MKKTKILTIFIVLMLSLTLVFSSCDKTGEETTGAPETTIAPSVTDTPTEPADETTSAPETTKTEETTEAPHTHSFGAWNTVKAASCTEEGVSERVCSCGEKETQAIAKIAHVEGEWVTDKVATCTEAGSKHLECSLCKASLSTESVSATGHTDGNWITDKAATCTDSGSKHQICSVCGETLKTDIIPASGHTDGEWIVDKEAAAGVDGSKHQVCSICGVTLKVEIIAAKPHTPGKWIVDREATCTEEGSKHQICTECGVTIKTEVIHIIAHTEVTDAAVSATCTKNGLTEGKHCSVCNAIIEMQHTVPMIAHTEAINPAVAATCTESGLTEGKYCSVCNFVIKSQEMITAKGHVEVIDVAKAATCTAEGLTEGKHCSVCNTVIKAQEKIPTTAHVEAIDAAKPATCTETGFSEGKHCSVCNTVIKAQETIPTVAHTESDWIIDKAATTAAEGSKHTECTVCKATLKTESIPKLEIPKIEYTVTVVDGKGEALSGIEVVFTKAGSEVAKATSDKSGKATAKLESGDYSFELAGVDSYYISSEVSTLTASAPAANVKLIPYASSPAFVYPGQENKEPANGNPGVLAGVYAMDVGSVRLSVEKDKMRYVFFAPKEGAIYRIYTDSDKVEVGYYGGSFFVYQNNTGKMLDDGKMELEVLHSQVGGTLVLGFKSTSAAVTECTVTIERYADMDITIDELEWVPYKPDAVFEKIETPKGYLVGMDLAVWTPFDAAATEIPVYFNEKDGYYHLESADGPVLYVRIGSKSSYQDALTAIAGTTNLGLYIYDENGEFLRKERYNEIIDAYAAAADDKYSVYPLDKDLYYILKRFEEEGWYDKTSPNYIFKEEEIIVMPFNGWLFACVYFK